MKKKDPNKEEASSCMVVRETRQLSSFAASSALWQGDVETFLDSLPLAPLFDLVVTSPPYNIGKPYEERQKLEAYLEWQGRIIEKCVGRLKPTGSICWEVGNYVEGSGRASRMLPLDLAFHPYFEKLGLQLRNRIVWKFGHGLHCKNRFSGRYEVILWYTKSDSYHFDLDAVRIPSKYPGKKYYKGPNAGKYSANPLGKNPEDVWDIPNVKSNHVEKTSHPCQFPVALVERLVAALTPAGGLVFDPFAGVGSSGVAASLRGRRFWGCEIMEHYTLIAQQRIDAALQGKALVRPLDRPIFDPALAGAVGRNPFKS